MLFFTIPLENRNLYIGELVGSGNSTSIGYGKYGAEVGADKARSYLQVAFGTGWGIDYGFVPDWNTTTTTNNWTDNN